MTDTKQNSEDLRLLDLLVVMAESWRLLLFVPLVAASLAYGYVWSRPATLVSDMVIGITNQSVSEFNENMRMNTSGSDGALLGKDDAETLSRSMVIEPYQENMSHLSLSLMAPAEPHILLGKFVRYLQYEEQAGRLESPRIQIEDELKRLATRADEIDKAIADFEWALDRIRKANAFVGSDYVAVFSKLDDLRDQKLAIKTRVRDQQDQLRSAPETLVVRAPSEPRLVRERSPFSMALLSFAGTLLLVLVYVFTRGAVRYWQSRPEDAAKLRRASNAVLFWRKH